MPHEHGRPSQSPPKKMPSARYVLFEGLFSTNQADLDSVFLRCRVGEERAKRPVGFASVSPLR